MRRRSRHETTGEKRRHVVLAGALDVVREEAQHDDHLCAAFVALRSSRLASIESGCDRSRIGIEGGLEVAHADRWAGIRRIVHHAVVHGVGTRQEIAVR